MTPLYYVEAEKKTDKNLYFPFFQLWKIAGNGKQIVSHNEYLRIFMLKSSRNQIFLENPFN